MKQIDMKNRSHVKKNRSLLLLTKHLRKVRQEAMKSTVQLQSDKIRRVAKRLTNSPYIRIEIET